MLSRYLHIRGLSRLMVALFAVQIIVGGFCLLTSEASAMPHTAAGQKMHVHCDMKGHVSGQNLSDQTITGHHTQDGSSSCYHCDQPDQLSSSNYSSVASLSLLLVDDISLTIAPLPFNSAVGFLSTRTPTGPPRSSSLLYTTTQRILI
jgi:hypothetical protein